MLKIEERSPVAGRSAGRVASQMVQVGDVGSVYGGTKISGLATVEEALVLSGLDFKVKLEPARYNHHVVDNRYWVVREDTDEPLDVVGSRFQPIQNIDAFAFVDRLVGEGAAVISSAGALYNGKMVWIDLNLGEFNIGLGDRVLKNLLVVNFHDGSAKYRVKATPERLRCQNALDYVLKGRKHAFDIAHTSNGKNMLEKAHHVIQYAENDFKTLGDLFMKFLQVKVKPTEVDHLIYKALDVTPAEFKKYQNEGYGRTPNWVEQHNVCRELIYSGPGSQGVSGTLWGVFNGINHFYDHKRTVRGANDSPDVKLDSRMFGHSAKGKRRTFQVCQEHLDKVHLN